MNKKVIFLSVVLVFALAVIFSCRKDVGKPASAAPAPPPPGKCDTINYTEDIKLIIDQNCASGAGCHTGGAPSGGVNLDTYAQVKAKAEEGRIKARVIDGNPSFMPQGGQLSAAQKELIQCWLNNGEKQ